MKNYYEFFDIYSIFRVMVKTQLNCYKVFPLYMSNKFFEVFVFDGTIHQISCTDTHYLE